MKYIKINLKNKDIFIINVEYSREIRNHEFLSLIF